MLIFPIFLLFDQHIRKSLDRLERLVAQDSPFYLQIAPYAPHIQKDAKRPIPLKRHMNMFTNATAPRNPNWNPADEFQLKKGGWLHNLPLMNESVIEFADLTYRSRAQALQGVDEIIEDVIRMLEAKGIIDNTYSKLIKICRGYQRRIGVVRL